MATKEQVRRHYDTEAEIFELFLDRRYRAYSAGLWLPGDELENAQRRNLFSIIKHLGITSRSAVLDIGCGWGPLTRVCVEDIGVRRYVGLTPSSSQVDYIQARFRGEMQIHQLPWQEFSPQSAAFDAVIALESMEHIASLESRKSGRAELEYRRFFEHSANCSTDSALLYVQSSLIRRQPRTRTEIKDVRYILETVFPGSALPDIELLEVASKGIYSICDMSWGADDYLKTLNAWLHRLHSLETVFSKRFGADQFAFFDRYLSACTHLFDSGVVDLLRLRLLKDAKDT